MNSIITQIRDLPERSIQTIRLGRCGPIKRKKYERPAGVCTITAPGTAEYEPQRDYITDSEGYPWGYFMTEDWCMEIQGIGPEWKARCDDEKQN